MTQVQAPIFGGGTQGHRADMALLLSSRWRNSKADFPSCMSRRVHACDAWNLFARGRLARLLCDHDQNDPKVYIPAQLIYRNRVGCRDRSQPSFCPVLLVCSAPAHRPIEATNPASALNRPSYSSNSSEPRYRHQSAFTLDQAREEKVEATQPPIMSAGQS